MIEHLEFRKSMAEKGYEYTPDQAKILFNIGESFLLECADKERKNPDILDECRVILNSSAEQKKIIAQFKSKGIKKTRKDVIDLVKLLMQGVKIVNATY